MHSQSSRLLPRTIAFREFVVLTAAIMACQAIAVDTMLWTLLMLFRAHQLVPGDPSPAA